MTTAKPLPDIDRPLTAPFWASLRDGRISVQRCLSCSTTRYPAAPICPACLARDSDWVDIEPEGELWSYVIYRRGLSPAFADDVPYAVGIVELDDRLQFIARLDAPVDSLKIGMRVRATFTAASESVTLLSFEPLKEPVDE